MRFFLDHDVPSDIARVLRAKGHSVSLLTEALDRQANDLTALTYALDQQMVTITCNRQDFLKLAETTPHFGVVVLIRRRTRMAECAALLNLLKRTGDTGLEGNVNFA